MISNERGFTVVEVIAASAILAIALVALATVVPLGAYGVQEGKQLSTATFLADQRLEQTRNAAWSVSPLPAGTDCLGVSATASVPPLVPNGVTCSMGAAGVTLFPDENSTQITGFPGYSRTVRVTSCAVTACAGITDAGMRLVSVTVTYTPLTASGGASTTPKSAVVSLVVARH